MDNKYFRSFPKTWEIFNNDVFNDHNVISQFQSLCEHIYESLTNIKAYDEELFNNNSQISIDDYISIFNNLYRNFYNEVFDRDYDLSYYRFKNSDVCISNGENYWLSNFRFYFLANELNKTKFNFIHDKNFPDIYTVVGIKDRYYSNIKSRVNAILMFERELKFLTMKPIFWNGVASTANQIDLSKNFIICGKLLFKSGWRNEHDKTKGFGENKIYQSASIINQNQPLKLFFNNISQSSPRAFVVYSFNLKDVVCACPEDCLSDEYINKNNAYLEQTPHYQIQKIDETINNENCHELFANSCVFSTLNSMLYKPSSYNEVVLKNPKPIAVVAINKKSVSYAKEIATENNIEYLGIMNENTCLTQDEKRFNK